MKLIAIVLFAITSATAFADTNSAAHAHEQAHGEQASSPESLVRCSPENFNSPASVEFSSTLLINSITLNTESRTTPGEEAQGVSSHESNSENIAVTNAQWETSESSKSVQLTLAPNYMGFTSLQITYVPNTSQITSCSFSNR